MYQLMNKDRQICAFDLVLDQDTGAYVTTNKVCTQELPWMIGDLDVWLLNRSAPKHRAHIARLLQQLGLDNVKGFIDYTKGLALTDTFWINHDNRYRWAEVNIFDHNFDETIAQIAFDGGMYGDTFSTTSPEFTTDGAFAKCWVKEAEQIYLLKKGSDGGANTGNEPYSEQYCSELLDALGFDHVPYEVVKFRGSLASKCPLMTNQQKMLVPMARCLSKHTINDVSDYAKNKGFREQLADMLVFDYLVANDDRHLNNFGVLVDGGTYEVLGMAPIFDNGAGLLPMGMMNDEFKNATSLENAINSKLPRFYASFFDTAKAFCTAEIKSKLRAITDGFSFEASNHKYNLDDDRLAILSKMVRERAAKLLK